MFADFLFPLLFAAQSIVIPLGHPRVNEAPRAPIEDSGPLWAEACDGSTDPNKAAPPVRIHANSYLVGTCGHSSILIVGDEGSVLIDGGEGEDADLIASNIRELGYGPEAIRFILHGNERADQLGGIAKLQRLSGATVVASANAAQILRRGRPDTGDPKGALPAVAVSRTISDGGEVRLGNILLTAIASPGALSWRWVSCDGGVCRTIVYAGVSPRDADSSAADVSALRASASRIANGPCDILVTSNPAASDMSRRLLLGKPLFDPDACKAFAAQFEADSSSK